MTHTLPTHLDPYTEPTDFYELPGTYDIDIIPGLTILIMPFYESPAIEVYKTSTLKQWSAEATANGEPPGELPEQYTANWTIADQAQLIKEHFGPDRIKELIELLEQD